LDNGFLIENDEGFYHVAGKLMTVKRWKPGMQLSFQRALSGKVLLPSLLWIPEGMEYLGSIIGNQPVVLGLPY